MSEVDATQVGRGKPPAATRFRPGQSGNPRGRPRGRTRQAPYEAVLGQQVTVREGERIRRMTAAEAFLLHITRRGLEGDGIAARAAMTAIEEARLRKGPADKDRVTVIVWKPVSVGSVNSALEALRAAVVLDPFRPTARLVIEPWLVEASLARLGEQRLSLAEQEIVWRSTRTPRKVNWPTWWTYTA